MFHALLPIKGLLLTNSVCLSEDIYARIWMNNFDQLHNYYFLKDLGLVLFCELINDFATAIFFYVSNHPVVTLNLAFARILE